MYTRPDQKSTDQYMHIYISRYNPSLVSYYIPWLDDIIIYVGYPTAYTTYYIYTYYAVLPECIAYSVGRTARRQRGG
jgi:hypothetical protein